MENPRGGRRSTTLIDPCRHALRKLVTVAGCALVAAHPAAAGSAAANAESSADNWCLTAPPRVRVSNPREDVNVRLIAETALSEAMHRLFGRTIVPIDAAAYRRMERYNHQPARGMHLYVARSGVMTPIDLPRLEFDGYAAQASYHASEAHRGDWIHLTSLMTSETRQAPRNFALLIESARPIREVLVYCIGGR